MLVIVNGRLEEAKYDVGAYKTHGQMWVRTENLTDDDVECSDFIVTISSKSYLVLCNVCSCVDTGRQYLVPVKESELPVINNDLFIKLSKQ